MPAWGVLHVDTSWYITQADLIVVQYELVLPDDSMSYCHGFVDPKEKYRSRDVAEQRAMEMCACLVDMFDSMKREGNGT